MAAADFPEKLQPLFTPSRYKVLYGGRGGAKSWGIARALLLKAAAAPLRVLCTREFQNSMADSVHALLKTQIDELGLDGQYEVQEKSIRNTVTGSEFAFEGLRYNVSKIKSFEGADIVWVEEANTVAKASWDVLIPTIRKPGSEIWLSFNPELDTDYTYKYFIKNTPPNTIKIEMSWRDNPWFPQVLYDEMMHLKATDEDDWLTIWEGKTRATVAGAIYAKEIRNAKANGRIAKVPYIEGYAVNCYFDLGWGDQTAIWFVQKVGFEFHAIDFLQDSARTLEWYHKEIRAKQYNIGKLWLPHDAGAKEIRTGKSVEEMCRTAGFKTGRTQNLSVATGINAVRMMFPNLYIDEDKCADGIAALTRYRYGRKDDGSASREPIHDWTSHPADALRTLGVSAKWGEGRPEAEDEGRRGSRPYENSYAGGEMAWAQ